MGLGHLTQMERKEKLEELRAVRITYGKKLTAFALVWASVNVP